MPRLPEWLAIGGLTLSLLVGMLVPVYTDETGWRLQERAGIDGGLDIAFNDVCGANTIAHAPWFMMPVRWFSAFTNQALADPFYLRGTGVVCALAWTVLLWTTIGKLESDPGKRTQLRTLAFSLLGLGVLPFLMVLSRPEQPIILTILLTVLLTFACWPTLSASRSAWLKVVAIIFLATIIQSYHLKGVLYAPVIFACLLVCARDKGTLASRLIGMAVLLLLTASSMHYWIERFRCPDDPRLAAMLARQNVAAVIAGHGNVFDLLSQLIAGANPLNYVLFATPISEPMSAWIPRGMFPRPISIAILTALLTLWSAMILMAAVALVGRLRTKRLRALVEPRVLIALAILACVLVWGASQLHKNVYESAHILPLLVIFAMLCLSSPQVGGRLEQLLPKLAWVAMSLALLSELTVIGLTVGPLSAAARTPGYLAKQPFSVSIAGYPAVRRDIIAAMAMSEMPTDRPLYRPLLDDLTYLALQDSYLPLHRLGVLSVWNGSIIDPAQYLRKENSDGAVVGCRYLPPDMRSVASRSGEICAVSRQKLDLLVASRVDRAAPPHPALPGEGRDLGKAQSGPEANR
jgi:hypothetical protein